MMSLDVIHRPAPRGGRPPIFGTVLRDGHGDIILVRNVYAFGANTGNTGSPRSEAWVALRADGYAPAVVRLSGQWWHLCEPSDFGEIHGSALRESLRRCGYERSDVWPGNPSPSWPTTIWDRRIILPDDDRWPRGRDTLRQSLRTMLAARNECPDDQVWRIDAAILALSPKTSEADRGR
jgi:hypothetical protein